MPGPFACDVSRTRSRSRWIRGGAAALAAWAGHAEAQPANDDCANALPLTVGQSVAGNTDLADVEDGVPFSCLPNLNALGVWYRVTGDGTRLKVSTCASGTDYDTLVAVFCGGCSDLRCIGFNDDSGICGFAAEFSWCSEPGRDYWVLVAGHEFDTGNFELRLTSNALPCDDPISCTDCFVTCPPDATPEGEFPCFQGYRDTFNAGCASSPPSFASIAVGGPPVCGASGVYLREDPDFGFVDTADEDHYRFAVTEPTRVSARLLAQFDAVFQLEDLSFGCPVSQYRGFAVDEACDTLLIEAYLFPGEYALMLTPASLGAGPCELPYVLSLEGEPFTPPSNDSPASAASLAPGAPLDGSTRGARPDLDVPICGDPIESPSVWYRVVGDGTELTVDTCTFADFDTRVAVYCESPLGLACIGADAGLCAPGSSVTWCSAPGQTYLVMVAGTLAEQGDFAVTLHSSGSSCGGAPACEPCRVTLSGTAEGEPDCADDDVDTFNAGCDADTPALSDLPPDGAWGRSGTFWRQDPEFGRIRAADIDAWRFELAEPSEVTLRFESEFHGRVNLIDLNDGCGGEIIPPLETSPCEPGEVVVVLNAGVYAAVVSPVFLQQVACGAAYTIRADASPVVLAPNDRCTSPADVLPGETVSGDTTFATLDAGIDPCFFSGVVSPGLWYRVRGDGDTFTASLCGGGDFDARLSVFCGACPTPLCIAFGDDECRFSPEVSWCTRAGQDYLILVHGVDAQGAFTLSVFDQDDACEFPAECPACTPDLTTTSDPHDPLYGTPDGSLDASDFFYFLDQFVLANLQVDFSGASDPNDPAYGVPDGVLDASDFFFYLDAFVAGCP